MRRTVILALAGMLSFAPALLQASGQNDKLQSLLDSKNKQIDDAIIKGDITPVLDLMSPSMMITNPVGAFISRNDLAQSLTSGALKYTSIKVSDEHFAQFGDVAVINFLSTETGTMQGHDISGLNRYTGIWAKQSGQWKLVVVQLTPVVSQPQ